MNMIFSADKNWGIGCQNDLLFRAKSDLSRFRKITRGNVVIMGYNTLLSLPAGKPLPDRTNFVLSRKPGLIIPDAAVFSDLDSLLHALSQFPEDEVFVIGGEQIYKQLMPYCKKAYVTKWDAAADADRFMDNLDEHSGWKLAETSEWMREDGPEFQYAVYIQPDYRPITSESL